MELMTIVGFRDMSFKGNDGSQVSGRQFFFTMKDDQVTGLTAGKFFLSAAVLANVGYVPNVGDVVEVYYNRFGKVSHIRLAEVQDSLF